MANEGYLEIENSQKKEWSEFEDSDFSTREEFLKARELGINDKNTLTVYNFIALFQTGTPIAISKIEGKTKIYEDDLEEICQKVPVSKLGKYMGDAGNFMRGEKTAYLYNCVIIDGSNVAFDNDGKAKLDRIKIVKKKAMEITELPVHVYVTAYLRYRIDNPDGLEELIKRKEVNQNPAGEDNDIFIIQAALEKNGYIISNDTLKDWKEANPNKADEIEQRKCTFNFHDDETVYFGDKLSTIKAPSGTI